MASVSTLAQLIPGTIFAQDFRVVRPLSEGGMGAIYVVEQLSTGAQRALKLMHPQLVGDPALRQRFAQEARVGASLRSDHVVQIVGAGVDAPTGLPWLAMELLEGRDLAAYVVERGHVDMATTRDVFAQLCHALAAAHAANIVHRDLKPENVFLADARRAGVPFTVKVLDFGIAKLVADVQTHHTQAIGSPLWMAPEQTEAGGDIRPATDVWALGLIAFRLLTGRFYWQGANIPGTSAVALMREIVFEPLVPASHRARELAAAERLPAGFDAWFARCVDRDVRARHPDAAVAWRELSPLLGADLSGVPTNAVVSAIPEPKNPYAAAPMAATMPAPNAPYTPYAPNAYPGYAPMSPLVAMRVAPARSNAVLPIVLVVMLLGAGGAFFAMRGGAASDSKSSLEETTKTPEPKTPKHQKAEATSEPSISPDPQQSSAGSGFGAGGGLGGLGNGTGIGSGKKPAKPVETATGSQGHLAQEEIRKVMRANQSRFRTCYEAGLKKDPTLSGNVPLHFVIDTTGAVESASASGGTLTDPTVLSCIVTVCKSLVFAAPDGGKVQVSYPMTFQAS